MTMHLIDNALRAFHGTPHRSHGESRDLSVPHHITPYGSGRVRTFFGDAGYALYRNLQAEHCGATGGEIRTRVHMFAR